MNMHPVKSSQIKEIGHDPAAQTLAVRFNTGALYHYAGVNTETFDAFKSAESAGAYFGKNIKGSFAYSRIDETKKEYPQS